MKPYSLKKSLGQHFLHDEQVCMRIVDAVTYTEGMKLLEVGPGGGALTKYLLEKDNIDYKAVEVDDEKVNYLLKAYPAIEGKLIHKDILRSEKPFEGRFNIIGNFPYNISSPIMFKVLDWEADIVEVVGMFQKEVAERIASLHGNKSYGILSVLMQAYFKVEYLFDVPQRCFTPPPKVMSGVVRFTNTDNPYNIEDRKRFKTFVKTAFSQRRKTLRNALKPILAADDLKDEVFSKRAEQLSVEDFVRLQKQYYS